MEKLSFTMENYLEAVYELAAEGSGARVSDIAQRLGVTKASTNRAMSALSEKGLIANEKYGEIFLTPEGRKLAKITSSKHRLLEEFFVQVLKVDAKTAAIDACAIEHVISSETIQAIQEFLSSHQGLER